MNDWRKKSKKFTRKQITYELEQLFILRQGFEQGYAFQESLQCMAAFCPVANTWQNVKQAISAGASVQSIFASLEFRPKTLRLLCSNDQWYDLAQATQKTIQLLTWELQVRSQIQKTFAYPFIMLLILIVFGGGFSLFVLPQLEFLQLSGTVWLFILPEVVGIISVVLMSSAVIGWWWWKHSSFTQRLRIWQVSQRLRFIQLWGCLRLALHCQLGLGQGQPLAVIFATESTSQHFFEQLLSQIHTRLSEGVRVSDTFQELGFTDPTWLSFFQWQPTNQQILIASEFYWQHSFRQIHTTFERWCQIGQTGFFLVIGMILIQFYLSLFLPIFEITTQF
ncbi:MAG: type II secretion system F family protein [Culicoidibacterales bacterium]